MARRPPRRQVKTAYTGTGSWASCWRGWGWSYLIPSWDTSSSVLAEGDVSLHMFYWGCSSVTAAGLINLGSYMKYLLVSCEVLFPAITRLSALDMVLKLYSIDRECISSNIRLSCFVLPPCGQKTSQKVIITHFWTPNDLKMYFLSSSGPERNTCLLTGAAKCSTILTS